MQQLTRLLKSGFTVAVRPLPTYYLDFIEGVLPYTPLPKRKVQLLAGDVVEYDYTPDEIEPSETDEYYDLWHKTYSAKAHNKEIDKQRALLRVDFLLSTCVDIVSGPKDISKDDWVHDLEAAFFDRGFRVPPHPGVRKLMFLKAFVITDAADRDWIIQSATYPDVTMTGIATALIGFKVMWDGVPLTDVLSGNKKSSTQYDIRFYEAEAAQRFSMPFDDSWYSLPVIVREHMIAFYLAKTAIENLQTQQSLERAKSKK